MDLATLIGLFTAFGSVSVDPVLTGSDFDVIKCAERIRGKGTTAVRLAKVAVAINDVFDLLMEREGDLAADAFSLTGIHFLDYDPCSALVNRTPSTTICQRPFTSCGGSVTSKVVVKNSTPTTKSSPSNSFSGPFIELVTPPLIRL